MKMSSGLRFPGRAAGAAAAVLMLLYVVAVALATSWFRAGAVALERNRRLLAECDRLAGEAERLQQENLALGREKTALAQDPFVIESVLREDRGLVGPGEVRLDPVPPLPPPVVRRAAPAPQGPIARRYPAAPRLRR